MIQERPCVQICCAHRVCLESSKQIDSSRGTLNSWQRFLSRSTTLSDGPAGSRWISSLYRLASWSHGIQWQVEEHLQVAFLELMLSFIFDTNRHPPYPVRKYPNNPNSRTVTWQLRKQFPTSDSQGYNLGSLLSGFIRTAHWADENLEIKLFAGNHQPDLTCLRKYFFRALKVPGFRARPILPKQDLVDSFCNKHLPNKCKVKTPIP